MTQRRICQKCVLPESPPHIVLDENGVCSVCHEYRKQKECATTAVLESDFIKILDKYRGKHQYDCLVMCSGGKDSTAALYFMKKRYHTNPLAFMFDHGFETEDAIGNVRRAVEKLGVDFLFYKTGFIKDLYKKIIKTKSKAVICHPCSIWYMELAFDIANRHGCPIIIAGWTKGQSNKQEVMSTCGCNIHNAEYVNMAQETQRFLNEELRDDPQYKEFPRSMEELLKKIKRKRQKALVLSPHWFLPYRPEEYVKIIKEELGWEYPKDSYPLKSTNCNMNFVSVHNAMRDYGYTHYHVEMSKLVREGVIAREEALRSLEINFSEELMTSILAKIGCALEDIKEAKK